MAFAYSIEHGLTPSTVRNYVRLMIDRMSGIEEVRLQDTANFGGDQWGGM